MFPFLYPRPLAVPGYIKFIWQHREELHVDPSFVLSISLESLSESIWPCLSVLHSCGEPVGRNFLDILMKFAAPILAVARPSLSTCFLYALDTKDTHTERKG